MDGLLTTREVAERLGIAMCTVTWRVRTGRMTAVHQLPGSGSYLFDAKEIEEIAKRDTSGELHKDNSARYRREVEAA